MKFDYAETIGRLDDVRKLYFYELLAHFLTVSMRGALFMEGIADADRIERAKWLNEIAHRITYKIYFMHRKPEAEWTDAQIWEMIAQNAAKHPDTPADVEAAVELAYGYVLENETEAAAGA